MASSKAYHIRLKCRYARLEQTCSVRPCDGIDFFVPNYRTDAPRLIYADSVSGVMRIFMPRTGAYRIGGDVMLKDESGQSVISMEDYALALIDEVENPLHHQTRFSVAY